MLTVQTATDIVLQNSVSFGVEAIPLEQAIRRVLAEALVADREFPPFDRVTMDGIAIRFKNFADRERDFLIEGLQPAGAPQMKLRNPQHCLEVMTGAMLPEGTDTVVRYEDVNISNGIATVLIDDVQPGQNIHRQGNDRRQGDVIVPPNRLLSPAEIGVAATIGKAEIKVKKLPRVVIVSTGDEIIGVNETPLPHQIRSSNPLTIQALLAKWKIQAARMHIPDNRKVIIAKLGECLEAYDVVILSGGVSEGKMDYVPDALSALGVRKLFHKVQQRPGKPFWFGKTQQGTVIFALPGNPVSSFLCSVRYVEPWLRKCLDLKPVEKRVAVLAENVVFKPNLTYFLQVQLEMDDTGRVLAKPVPGGGSGDLANLTEADGFLELPLGQDVFKKGDVFPFWIYRILRD